MDRFRSLSQANSEEEWKQIANDFGIKWNFDNCLGSIDRKHIKNLLDQVYTTTIITMKHYAIKAVINANYEYIIIDVGANGDVSNEGVL